MSASIALSNLRAVAILFVVIFHSILAYLVSAPAIAPLDAAPYRWQAFPIVDAERWFGFDLFCASLNLSMMALMFFLSGLFVAPSLAAKGARTYLADRLRRLALPLILVVIFLMPLAYYPAHRLRAADPSLGAYLQEWFALPFWPSGPQWFLWLLLIMTVLAAGLHRFAPSWTRRLVRAVTNAGDNPLRLFAGVLAVSAVAYVPLGVAFSQWTWTNFGPIAFETTRPLLYLVYFFAGFALGARGLNRGLLACDGALARRWPVWLALWAGGFALWGAASAHTLGNWDEIPLPIRIAAALGVVLGCGAGCFFKVAVFLRFARRRIRLFDSLSANAYGIYLLHYVFVVWLQYALLDLDLFAVGKAAIVIGGTLALSWTIAARFGSLTMGARPIPAKRVAPTA